MDAVHYWIKKKLQRPGGVEVLKCEGDVSGVRVKRGSPLSNGSYLKRSACKLYHNPTHPIFPAHSLYPDFPESSFVRCNITQRISQDVTARGTHRKPASMPLSHFPALYY
jgi:hypothetical protein